jgi:hypothetical protein
MRDSSGILMKAAIKDKANKPDSRSYEDDKQSEGSCLKNKTRIAARVSLK